MHQSMYMVKIEESPQVIVIYNRIDNSNEGLLSKNKTHIQTDKYTHIHTVCHHI